MTESDMLDTFFVEGQDAFQDGVDRSDCPYDEGTDGQSGWLRGWDHEHDSE